MSSRSPTTLAAVDLGSNSFHMMVARTAPGYLHVLDRLRERVALAEGLDRKKRLTPAAQERALKVLRRFGQRLSSLPAGAVRAVGTNTLRQATNSREFLVRARAALGRPIEVISGQEEARLIYLGVAQALAHDGATKRRLVVDIGGGSTECIVGERLRVLESDSLFMGCVTWSHRFFPEGVLTARSFDKARLAARLELEPLERRYAEKGWSACVGASGTILAVEGILRDTGWSDAGITRAGLRRLIAAMVAAKRADRLALPSLTSERASVLAGGVAILAALFDAFALNKMTASSGALREGVLWDLIGRLGDEDVREQAIASACERHHVDLGQAARVDETARRLFAQVSDAWDLGKRERQVLSWAARIHEIGLSISHAGYHKHGAYLVTHAHLPGFSRDEQELLAALMRNHRRKMDVEAFASLAGLEERTAVRLCLLLRLAVVLNRSRSSRPLPRFTLTSRGKRLRLDFPEGWLDAHPLTEADLLEEARLLEASGIVLRAH